MSFHIVQYLKVVAIQNQQKKIILNSILIFRYVIVDSAQLNKNRFKA